jgi:hypothetical protein
LQIAAGGLPFSNAPGSGALPKYSLLKPGNNCPASITGFGTEFTASVMAIETLPAAMRIFPNLMLVVNG